MRHALAALLLAAPASAQTLDGTPRLAVVSAFAPELEVLRAALGGAEEHVVHGHRFVAGELEGRPVVLFLSGVSMVNAAMTTQMALDRFEVVGIVFSGIAGGVDPALAIGDVVVPERWGPYLDAAFAREAEGGHALPPWMSSDFEPFGMIHSIGVEVIREGMEAPETRNWFPVHEPWLEVAREVASGAALEACGEEGACLSDPPEVMVGGSGVSGTVFVDNAAFREHVFEAFDARVLDMESAAVAQVAWVNEVPFIAFRSLSDLAGGGGAENEMPVFLGLAAGNSAEVVRAFLAALD